MNKRILGLLILMSLFFILAGCNTNNKTARIEITSNYWMSIFAPGQEPHETTLYYDVKEGDVIEASFEYPIKITVKKITVDTVEIETDVELEVMDDTYYLGTKFVITVDKTLALQTPTSDFGAWYKISVQSISG